MVLSVGDLTMGRRRGLILGLTMRCGELEGEAIEWRGKYWVIKVNVVKDV